MSKLRPFEGCPQYDECSVPLCPLDPDINLRNKLSGEGECGANKPAREKIASKYAELFPYKGLTKQESANRKRSEEMRLR